MAALVLGIVGIFFGWLYLIPPVLGLVFGAVAMHRINTSNGGRTGMGMAVAGLTLGIVGTLMWGLLFVAVFPG